MNERTGGRWSGAGWWGAVGVLAALAWLAACAQDLTNSMTASSSCPPHDQNTATNACRLDGITVKATPTDDDDDDDEDDDHDDEQHNVPRDDENEVPGGGTSAACDDPKVEALRSEYSPKWACDKFQNSGGTANFNWSELNGHWAGGNESKHAPWGYVDEGLATGLQKARDAYGEAILVTSGYRCPNGNASIPGADRDSDHMKGRAVDIYRYYPDVTPENPSGQPGRWSVKECQELEQIMRGNGGRPVPCLDDEGKWSYPEDRHLHISWE